MWLVNRAVREFQTARHVSRFAKLHQGRDDATGARFHKEFTFGRLWLSSKTRPSRVVAESIARGL